MSGLDVYIIRRLLATGKIKSGDEPNQANFDSAFEADITAIVMRVIQAQDFKP
jgi:hypothetical protein